MARRRGYFDPRASRRQPWWQGTGAPLEAEAHADIVEVKGAAFQQRDKIGPVAAALVARRAGVQLGVAVAARRPRLGGHALPSGELLFVDVEDLARIAVASRDPIHTCQHLQGEG